VIVLDTLERRFIAHVRGGETFPSDWCAQGLVDSGLGLAIYANAYHSRLREALLNDHPVLSSYLGDELWSRLCRGYIDAHPSRVRSLRHFGASLPDWLAGHAPFSGHPEVSELAAWERILLDVFDAGDAARMDWSAMQSLDAAMWPDLRLRFHPSLRWMPTSRNTVEVWRALKDGGEPPIVSAAAPSDWLLWRDAERITRFRPLASAERIALQVCHLQGDDFSRLCETLAQDRPCDEVPGMAIALLRRWFDDGLVCGIAGEDLNLQFERTQRGAV
jgi:hypothetical protein